MWRLAFGVDSDKAEAKGVMHILGTHIVIALLLSGCTQEVIPYCQKASDCPPGMTCNTKLYSCFLADPDHGTRDVVVVDMAPDQPMDAGADLAPPDLTPEDLRPLDLFKPDLPGVGTKCGGDTACAGGGGCVDGYCCDTSCQGKCEACDVSGLEGTCSPVPAGTDPASECTGTKPCGADTCNGQGKCTVPAGIMKVCGSKCNASDKSLVDENFCDGLGNCSSTPASRSCTPYICDGKTSTCATGCGGNTGCVDTSVCDRTQAHKKGTGECISPSKVALVGTVKDLEDEVAMQSLGTTTRTHIRLSSGTYSEDFKWSGSFKLIIVGDAGVIFKPASGSTEPGIIYVQDGADVTLQGITITGSLANQSGVACQTKSSGLAWVTLLECGVSNNSTFGITTNRCDMVARRNKISTNGSGGIRVANGSATLTNNLITNNGQKGGGSSGGVELIPGGGGTIHFSNNTLVDNLYPSNAAVSGMLCQGVSTLLPNNVIFSNATTNTKALTTGCTFASSLVPQGGGKNGNFSKLAQLDSSFKPKPGISPCIDAGQATAVTAIDLEGSPRPAIKNGKVDVGCYEVK